MSKEVKAESKSNVYSGAVKLTLKKGSKPYKVIKQHNNGTVEFFKYILNTMKGSVLPNDRPAHVKLIYRQGEFDVVSKYGVIYEEVTSAAAATESTVPKAYIIYKFVIPETVVQPGTISGLQLESASGVKYAAVLFDEFITISNTNTNIELEWKISICDR